MGTNDYRTLAYTPPQVPSRTRVEPVKWTRMGDPRIKHITRLSEGLDALKYGRKEAALELGVVSRTAAAQDIVDLLLTQLDSLPPLPSVLEGDETVRVSVRSALRQDGVREALWHANPALSTEISRAAATTPYAPETSAPTL